VWLLGPSMFLFGDFESSSEVGSLAPRSTPNLKDAILIYWSWDLVWLLGPSMFLFGDFESSSEVRSLAPRSTPNLQCQGLNFSWPLTCVTSLAWVALPGAYASASITPRNMSDTPTCSPR
jgi:hypothetical protein